MRVLLMVSILSVFVARGGEPGEFVEQANLVGEISQALEASGIEHLTPRIVMKKEEWYSYHLKSVSYLGTIGQRDEKFILTTAQFIRSSLQGHRSPPARGHGFLLCLTTDFRLVSHCRLDAPDVELVGTELRRGKEKVADFAVSDRVRKHGYLIDGGDVLVYPFQNALPEPRRD